MVANYQEAQFLYSMCETERSEQEIALQVAQAGLQLAKRKFQYAQKKFQYARKRLTNVEFRLGRARYMIKKGGFSDILRQKSYGNMRLQPASVLRTCIPSDYFILLTTNIMSDNHLITIPEAEVPIPFRAFTLRLD